MIRNLKMIFLFLMLIVIMDVTSQAGGPQQGPKLPPKCADGFVYRPGVGCVRLQVTDPGDSLRTSELNTSIARESVNFQNETTWEFIRMLFLPLWMF